MRLIKLSPVWCSFAFSEALATATSRLVFIKPSKSRSDNVEAEAGGNRVDINAVTRRRRTSSKSCQADIFLEEDAEHGVYTVFPILKTFDNVPILFLKWLLYGLCWWYLTQMLFSPELKICVDLDRRYLSW